MNAMIEMRDRLAAGEYFTKVPPPTLDGTGQDEWREDRLRLAAQFKVDVLEKFGLASWGYDGAVGDKAYEMAWDKGHSEGLLGVLNEFANLVVLLEKTKIGEEYVFECGETRDAETAEGEPDSQNPVEWAVMLRGAETMLYGVGRADAFKEMADRVGELSTDGWTAPQLGRYMAAYVRDVMQEEVATSG